MIHEFFDQPLADTHFLVLWIDASFAFPSQATYLIRDIKTDSTIMSAAEARVNA
jgi:hypothetical protein